ncbi:adenylate cyclase type 10-like [Saccoglossus kowalevskii]
MVTEVVIEEMTRLSSEACLELCYRPLYTVKPGACKIVFQNARSLHKHFSDLSTDHNITAASIITIAESRLLPMDNDETYALDVRKLSSVIPDQIDIGSMMSIANKAINDPASMGIIEEEVDDHDDQLLTTRQAVFDATSEAEEKKLRLYVMGTVLQKIDDDLPLEYLSEMRQVTIIFINLTLAKGSKHDESDALQSAFNTVYNSLKRYHGRLNKVFMFDKGCTFLAIFGLPGDKHEDDCAHALQCSHKMHDLLKSTPSIIQVSIGVTTGKTFCGVVGHKYRHEYTVIGSKVNMAARLMMHYPGRLSCDSETFHHSKLSTHFFTELGHREMKGVQNPGIIREFVETKKNSKKQLENINENEFPLLGKQYMYCQIHAPDTFFCHTIEQKVLPLAAHV